MANYMMVLNYFLGVGVVKNKFRPCSRLENKVLPHATNMQIGKIISVFVEMMSWCNNVIAHL